MSMKNSNDTIGNRTRDLLTCSAVPQPTAPPRSQAVDHEQTYYIDQLEWIVNIWHDFYNLLQGLESVGTFHSATCRHQSSSNILLHILRRKANTIVPHKCTKWTQFEAFAAIRSLKTPVLVYLNTINIRWELLYRNASKLEQNCMQYAWTLVHAVK